MTTSTNIKATMDTTSSDVNPLLFLKIIMKNLNIVNILYSLLVHSLGLEERDPRPEENMMLKNMVCQEIVTRHL